MLNREGANPMIRTVTRASTALLVTVAVLAGAAAVTVANEDVFSDVPDTHEYAVEINAAHAAGLVNGIGDGLYAPDRVLTTRQAFKLANRLLVGFQDEDGKYIVTRAETAALLIIGICGFWPDRSGCEDIDATDLGPAGDDVFSDVPNTHEYAAEINAAHAAGLVNGVGGGRYVPDRILTGRQAFKLATRLLEQFTDETGQLEVTRGEAAALLIRGLCGFSPDTPGCTN